MTHPVFVALLILCILVWFQFGFRKSTFTKMAVAMLKEIIFKYNENNSSVYMVFLDLSKAFDKVNINILMSKLM